MSGPDRIIVDAALDDATTLHRVIADIRAVTVGGRPMLSELAVALVDWRDAAVDIARAQAFVEGYEAGERAERKACVAECQHIASADEGNHVGMRAAEHCAAAIRKRGEG